MNPDEYEYLEVDEYGYPAPAWFDVQLFIANVERMLQVDAANKYQAARIAEKQAQAEALDRLRLKLEEIPPPSRRLRFRFWLEDMYALYHKVWW